MKRFNLLPMLLFTTVFIAACGGDDRGGSSDIVRIDVNVATDTPASDMNEDEVTTFCVSIYEALYGALEEMESTSGDIVCATEGYDEAMEEAMDGGDNDDILEACEEAVESCEEEKEEEEEEDDDDDDDELDNGLPSPEDACEGDAGDMVANCDATAGDIAICMSAIFTNLVKSMAEMKPPSCSELSAEYFEKAEKEDAENTDVELPKACKNVFAECSEFSAMAQVGE